MKPDDVIKIELTVAEWDIVVAALHELPAKYVNPIINKIRQTAASVATPAT